MKISIIVYFLFKGKHQTPKYKNSDFLWLILFCIKEHTPSWQNKGGGWKVKLGRRVFQREHVKEGNEVGGTPHLYIHNTYFFIF